MPSTCTRLNSRVSPFAGKSALVTGASAGLGEEFALQLADLGLAHLVLTARRADRLEELKRLLVAANPALRVDAISVDVATDAGVNHLIADLDQRAFAPDLLIIVALTRLTRWALPGMLAKKSGWICNVGSTAGLIPLPTFAVYAATKAYVNSFSEALRIELHGSGINVIALCPGPVETEFGQVATRENSKRAFAPPKFLCVSKTNVVRGTLSALARGQGRYIPGLLVRLPMLLAESTPRWILRLVFNLMTGDFRREREGK
jgi:short-subunit dehydrogenase